MKKEKRKKKIDVMTTLVILLLLIGLGIMFYPKVCDMYYNWEMSREIAQYNRIIDPEEKDYSEYWNPAEEYNQKLAEDPLFYTTMTDDHKKYVSKFLNPLGTGMMGYIDIPAIHVHLPIYQGTEEKALQSGAGYWLGTSLPTGGENTHCVLTAHNGLVKAKLFTDLDKLVEGDTFTLSILDREMTYEVDQILITNPGNLEPLCIVEGKDYVTLYTCYPYGVNTERLLVRGHRIEISDAAGNLGDQKIFLWLIPIILIQFLMILFILIWIKRKKKKEMEKHDV